MKVGVKLVFNFGFNLKESYVKVLTRDKLSFLLKDNEEDQGLKRERASSYSG